MTANEEAIKRKAPAITPGARRGMKCHDVPEVPIKTNATENKTNNLRNSWGHPVQCGSGLLGGCGAIGARPEPHRHPKRHTTYRQA